MNTSLLPVLGLAVSVGVIYWGLKGGAANFLRALGNTQTQNSGAPPNQQAQSPSSPSPVSTLPGDSLKGGNFSFSDSIPDAPPTVGSVFFNQSPQGGMGYEFPL